MSTNHFSEEVEARLRVFFNEIIDPKDMAKTIREVNYLLSLYFMRSHKTDETELPNIDDNFYWMNRLAEVLDPYFDVE
ncbi:hypothetical protein [Flavobacterium ginsenosidimutans]|uniref:Uncharacterized protein n=1 Tax=Flavobacterium ginsenosidimutans TaxID=687844 RepID=A0ABZ2QBW9_9FLAO|nr:hypothetical protein [Flavobacterium ginsenosidimutans]KAF2329788.1 hypothetical protein DM444_16215 [Flavobacterium ginsenosidimutans]